MWSGSGTVKNLLKTVAIIKRHCPEARAIADIGSGNGIASIAFALEGHKVFSIEPDPSIVIGAGAIRKLTNEYHLNGKVIVSQCFGEATGLQDRQWMWCISVRPCITPKI